MSDITMRQVAPYPDELADLVARLRYRPGWRLDLRDIVRDPASSHGAEAAGMTFIVTTCGYDSYHPEQGESYRVNHYFPVPAATYNRASWLRWLFDCLVRVETHETMEFFALRPECDCDELTNPDLGHTSECAMRSGPPTRPFAPTHGPGDDPYVVHEYADAVQRWTRFTGDVVTPEEGRS